MAFESTVGASVRLSALESIGTQAEPLLPASVYCFQLTAGGT